MSAIHKNYPVPNSQNGYPFAVAAAYTPKRYVAAATSLVFIGHGAIHTVAVGTGATGGVVELFDDTNTTSPTNQIAKISAVTAGWFLLDVCVINGLVIKLTNAPDVTLSVVAPDNAGL